MSHSVLFVCTANICRSPMARGLFSHLVDGHKDDWTIDSAGTWAMPGQVASTNGVLALENRGIDISLHRSKEVNQVLVSKFQLILVMERGHKEAMRIEFPQAASRIFLLSEMIGQYFDIADPYGSTFSEYDVTASEIDEILRAGFERIKELSEEDHT